MTEKEITTAMDVQLSKELNAMNPSQVVMSEKEWDILTNFLPIARALTEHIEDKEYDLYPYRLALDLLEYWADRTDYGDPGDDEEVSEPEPHADPYVADEVFDPTVPDEVPDMRPDKTKKFRSMPIIQPHIKALDILLKGHLVEPEVLNIVSEQRPSKMVGRLRRMGFKIRSHKKEGSKEIEYYELDRTYPRNMGKGGRPKLEDAR